MTDFPLFSLNPTTLELVINKFRIQQTCRDIQEFIQKSRNIRVHMYGIFRVIFNGSSWKCRSYLFAFPGKIDLKCFYKSRLDKICLPEDSDGAERLCDSLKEYQITCTELNMNWHGYHKYQEEWTTEQCATLESILKPVKTVLNSEGFDLHQAMFQIKTLKEVTVHLDPDDAATVAAQLLPTVTHLDINVSRTSDPLELVRDILQIFFYKPYPKLRYFGCSISHRSVDVTDDDLERQLYDYQLIVDEIDTQDVLVEMPPYFLSGSMCRITRSSTDIAISVMISQD